MLCFTFRCPIWNWYRSCTRYHLAGPHFEKLKCLCRNGQFKQFWPFLIVTVRLRPIFSGWFSILTVRRRMVFEGTGTWCFLAIVNSASRKENLFLRSGPWYLILRLPHHFFDSAIRKENCLLRDGLFNILRLAKPFWQCAEGRPIFTVYPSTILTVRIRKEIGLRRVGQYSQF
jgi:hypothetical protein